MASIKKKILLATRPLIPPWDEASKNFAYFLGTKIKQHRLTLMTTTTPLTGLSESAYQETIFSKGHFTFTSKVELFRYLRKVRGQFDVTHYLFTPTKQNTRIIRYLAKPTYGKTLQTVATLRDDLYSASELHALLFADHIVVYTDLSKQKLLCLGFTNVTRIYPGIDLQRYSPQTKNTDILSQLGCTDQHFIVMYPGEYARLGATDMLTTAFIDYFTNNPQSNMRFVFACRVKNADDAKKKSEVQKQLADAGVLAYIAFSDTIADMPALYNTADVIIFPVENLRGKFDVPLVIIEAYACAKPVILSDLEQFREFANPDICVTIPKNSPQKLLETLKYLQKNPKEGVRIGYNARRFVEKCFNLEQTARQYEDIYEQL
ncbi:MAG: glycosyltransferase family 4 protein [Minisyncoccota bacterium]